MKIWEKLAEERKKLEAEGKLKIGFVATEYEKKLFSRTALMNLSGGTAGTKAEQINLGASAPKQIRSNIEF